MKNKMRLLAALLAAIMLSASSVCAFADEAAADATAAATAATEVKDEAKADAAETDGADKDAAEDEAKTEDEAKAESTADEAKAEDTAKENAAAPIVLTVAGNTISVSGAEEGVNGVIADAKTENLGGAVMLPLRAVCEKLGCKVEWYAAERQVVIVKSDSLRTITLDAASMTTLRILPIVSEDNAMAVNKTVTELAPAPMLIGDLTYVPVAFFEAMGLTVSAAAA